MRGLQIENSVFNMIFVKPIVLFSVLMLTKATADELNSYATEVTKEDLSNDLSSLRSNKDLEEQLPKPIDALARNIPGNGIPYKDYPLLATVPETNFECLDQESPGYYADTSEEAKCQVFHICNNEGTKDSFLCPNGTLFNQQYFVCDWWFNVDCQDSAQFFRLKEEIGKVSNLEEDEEISRSLESSINERFIEQEYDSQFSKQLDTPSSLYTMPDQMRALPLEDKKISDVDEKYSAPIRPIEESLEFRGNLNRQYLTPEINRNIFSFGENGEVTEPSPYVVVENDQLETREPFSLYQRPL